MCLEPRAGRKTPTCVLLTPGRRQPREHSRSDLRGFYGNERDDTVGGVGRWGRLSDGGSQVVRSGGLPALATPERGTRSDQHPADNSEIELTPGSGGSVRIVSSDDG